MDNLGELNPIQYQKAAVETQKARIETFKADNPNVTIPPVYKPEAALPAPAGAKPPLAEMGSVAEHVAIGGIAAVGAIAETVVTATVGAMVQEAQEQNRMQQIRRELDQIRSSQKPPEPKTALGKPIETGKPPVPIKAPAPARAA
jgi:hypothetical protein